jgi:hypothetical protein
MKNILLLLSLFILVPGVFNAQSTSIAWQYTTAATTFSDDVVSKPHSAGVFVAAQVNFNIVCYMVSPSGTLLWSHSFDHGQAERIVDVEIESSTGNIYVLVNTQPLNAIDLGMDYIILKYSASGTLMQTLVHNHLDSSYSNENDDGYDMVLDASGNIYVLARHFHGSCTTADTKIVIDKYNSSLALQWNYSSPSSCVQPLSICFNSNGKLFASYKYNFLPMVGLFNPTTGTIINETFLPVPGTDGSETLKLQPDNFGNIFGVADYYMDGMPGVFISALIKVDNTCQTVWTDTLGDATTGNDYRPNDLVIDAAGALYVSYTSLMGLDKYTRLAKTNSNGARAWTKTIGPIGYYTTAYDLDITLSNDILIATSVQSNSATPVAAQLRKFDTQGNVTWTSQTYSCQTNTRPNGRISVAQNGNIYLSGDGGTSIFTISFGGFATDLKESFMETNLSLFPNPCESTLNFSLKTSAVEGSDIIIRNILGETVYTTKMGNELHHQIDVKDLKAGYYLFSIENGGSILSRKAFVRN